MYGDSEGLRRVSGRLLLVSAVVCFTAVACADIRPEPDVEEGGMLDSPTHEQDALRDEENRKREGAGNTGSAERDAVSGPVTTSGA